MKGMLGKLYIATCLFCVIVTAAGMYLLDVNGCLIKPSEDVAEVTESTAETGQGEAEEPEADKMTGLAALSQQWEQVRQKYDKLVVLDAGHGGSDLGETAEGMTEKALTLAVVQRAEKLLEEQGIKVICTRTNDEEVPAEDRVLLANGLHADMLVSVHVAKDEDSSIYGISTRYNNSFFLPGLNSADFSYLLLEKVAASTNEKALSMELAPDEKIVTEAEIPVALLEIGYLSNAQECKLLSKGDYLDRIAQGICDAVLAGYEKKEQEDTPQ